MALRNIIQELAASYGISTTNVNERALLLSRINRAARELYETKNLFGSLFEDIFDVNVDANVVALPWYVKTIRGMRYYDGRVAAELEDIANRYFGGINDEVWYLQPRFKEKSPLCREISNQSILKFSIPEAESASIQIIVSGPTDKCSLKTETVTIPAGSITGQTMGNYQDPLKYIRKVAPNTCDITVKDVEDNELATIPNNLLRSEYNIFQILDSETPSNTNFDAIEVLYEKPFISLVNDEDEFIFGDSYDDAIIWKFMEHRAKTKEEALAYFLKTKELLNSIWNKAKMGIKQKLGFRNNAYFRAPYKDGSYYGVHDV